MTYNLEKASQKLSELELNILADNLQINVIWFRVMSNSENWIIKRHMHSSYEFHFVYEGKSIVNLDNQKNLQVNAGEFYLTAPGIYHEQLGIDGEKYIEFCLNCDLKLIEDIPSEAQQIIKIFTETDCCIYKDQYGILSLFNQALQEAYYKNLGYYNNIRSLTVMLITTAARTIVEHYGAKYDIFVKKRKNAQRFEQIERFVNDNVSNNIGPKDLATFMHLSDKQIGRIIQVEKKVTTKQYINSVKYQKAKELLINTDFSIKQIADKLGFSSEYYFNQFFKKEQGIPPGMFRKKNCL